MNADDPAAQIAAVRTSAPDAVLIVDANEAWDMDLVRAMQPHLAVARVALLEQPLAAAEDGALTGFRPTVPICADESCHVAADVAGLADRYQAVNIKLDKTGGLTAALDLAGGGAGARPGRDDRLHDLHVALRRPCLPRRRAGGFRGSRRSRLAGEGSPERGRAGRWGADGAGGDLWGGNA